jgi:hypothetical protein
VTRVREELLTKLIYMHGEEGTVAHVGVQ